MKKEDIRRLMGKINELKESGIPVIVEGQKDKKALQELGIQNISIMHSPGMGISERIGRMMHEMDKKEVIILTDLDKKGKKYYGILKKELSENGFKIDDGLRNLLIELRISHVEGLSSFVQHSIDEKS